MGLHHNRYQEIRDRFRKSIDKILVNREYFGKGNEGNEGGDRMRITFLKFQVAIDVI